MSYNLRSFKQRVAVTGGAGFIGSNLLLILVPKYSDYLFVNVDCLTYAGNLTNLVSISNSPNYEFEKVDISDFYAVEKCFNKHAIDSVIHLAAESHVDRSILGPAQFVKTNITGTFNLLEMARRALEKDKPFRFHNVSTDEVFGSLDNIQTHKEEAPFKPNSPYAASKAAADHLVRSYYQTYGLDVVTSRCSNNYGPFQFPEKLIPLVINNALNRKEIPIYGDGKQVRDWLFVQDHCNALELIFHNGKAGESYNVSSNTGTANIDLVRELCNLIDELAGTKESASLLKSVEDRPGHDRRYAIDSSKLRDELGWEASTDLYQGLKKTVEWYLENKEWLNNCISGEYQTYYEKQYANR